MEASNKFLKTVILSLVVMIGLSCNLMSSLGQGEEQPEPTDPSLAETEIALRVMATSLVNEQLTLQAVQAQMTAQVPAVQATQTSPPPQPSPIPTKTDTPPPAALVLDIQTSVSTFYCYQSPYELTITVRVSDINRGMAVYYHIQDKNSGVSSDGQAVNLRRQTGDTRKATIIGGGSMDQNLQFPPMMGESYFIYQVISDDGSYRSPAYSNVTFFPCGQ